MGLSGCLSLYIDIKSIKLSQRWLDQIFKTYLTLKFRDSFPTPVINPRACCLLAQTLEPLFAA